MCSACRKPRIRERKLPLSRHLSFREKQIAQLVCQAKLNKEIAYELCLTEGTIKEYLNRIFRKLEVKDRTQLAIWTMRNLEAGRALPPLSPPKEGPVTTANRDAANGSFSGVVVDMEASVFLMAPGWSIFCFASAPGMSETAG